MSMVDPVRAERDALVRALRQVRTQPRSHDPLAPGELALGVAAFDHAIDLFARLPAQAATRHVRACLMDPCPQFYAYGIGLDRTRQIVKATLTKTLELRATLEDQPASLLRMSGGQPWTETMTTAWFTPTAPGRPQDLPSGIAVPSTRTRHLADSAIDAFLEHRDERGDDEEQARQRAISTVLQAEADRECRPERPLITRDGLQWTDAMSRAMFDPRAADRPTELPWNLAVPPRRVQALAEEAISLFVEYYEMHGRPIAQARRGAVADVVQGENARELLEPDQAEPTPTSWPRPGELADSGPAARGVWCSYLEYDPERGTVLDYGHVVAADGTRVLIRREAARQQEPLVRVPRSSVDFQPLRREGEPPWQIRNRLHLGAKRTSVRQVGDVVMALKPDLAGRWGVAEQGVVTEVFGSGEHYAYAVTFAGEWERPEFLGSGPTRRVYYFKANEVSGPVPPVHARVRPTVTPPDPQGAQRHAQRHALNDPNRDRDPGLDDGLAIP